jgi:hypothetical protein
MTTLHGIKRQEHETQPQSYELEHASKTTNFLSVYSEIDICEKSDAQSFPNIPLLYEY